MNNNAQSSGGGLPDFSGGSRSGGSSSGLPVFSAGGSSGGGGEGGGQSPWDSPPPAERPSTPGDPDGGGRGKGPLLAALIGGCAFLVVLLGVGALVLWQTVLSGGSADPTAKDPTSQQEPAEDPETSKHPEYTPTDDPSAEPESGEQTLLEKPTTECTLVDNEVTTEQAEGVLRGGGLEVPVPEDWNTGTNWYSQTPYATDMSFIDQPVESGWYTVVGVGAVSWPEAEGEYPGAQEAARAIFQCSLTTDDAEELYDSPVDLSNYREEQITIDGMDAWLIQGDAAISDTALLHTVSAWRKVTIVVETPDGPAVFDGGAAVGHDQQVADLQTMIDELHAI